MGKLSFLILSTFTVLFFQNCAKPFDVQASVNISYVTDPTFASFIEDFESYHKMSVGVPIVFDKLDPNLAGVCYRSFHGTEIHGDYIKIDRDEWPKMSLYQQQNLIFHELGHCVLNREHTPVNSVLICPTSFMHPQVMTTYCLQQHFYDYVKEMFP